MPWFFLNLGRFVLAAICDDLELALSKFFPDSFALVSVNTSDPCKFAPPFNSRLSLLHETGRVISWDEKDNLRNAGTNTRSSTHQHRERV
jgi:hypothetical protein